MNDDELKDMRRLKLQGTRLKGRRWEQEKED
jgi:hypothetical protein